MHRMNCVHMMDSPLSLDTDLICADEAGVAIIPQDKIALVLEHSQKIDMGDAKRKADIDKGVPIADLWSKKYK